MPHGRLSARLGIALVFSTLFFGAAINSGAAPAPSTTANFPPLGAAGGGGSAFGLVTHIATRFGVYGQQSGPMDVATGTGAGWIREEIRWDWVEHPLGNWDWGFSDEMVQDARGRNLQILGLLGYNNSAQTMGQTNFTYPDIGLWKTYVSQVVSRYKGTIHTWEVWNEPDVPMFWKGSVADYVNLLRETYTTIKAIDPTATVLNGACSNLDLNWFNDFLNRGGAQYTDALAFHPYVLRSSLDNGDYQKIDLAHFADIQKQTGKSWWFTEIGWSSATSNGGGVGSEQAQASYMIRQYVESIDYFGLDVKHVFWYNFHDDGTDPNNPENNYGLIRNDWRTPKYSYTAFQQMTSHLTGATPKGTVDSGAGIAYRFDRNGTTVDVVWGGGRTNLPTTATKAQAYDMTGNPLPTDVSGGQIHIDIGGDPVFIEHTGTPPAAPPAPPPANPGNTFTLPSVPQIGKPGVIGKK
jgi:hypothetical protein